MDSSPQAYVCAISAKTPENFEICRVHGVWGFLRRSLRAASKVHQGDLFWFHVGGIGFLAIGRVTGPLVAVQENSKVPWDDGRDYGATIAVDFLSAVDPPVALPFPHTIGYKVDAEIGISTNDLLSSFFPLTQDQHSRLLTKAFGAPSLPSVHLTPHIGVPYKPANEAPDIAPKDPFEVDPDLVDRGTSAHARTQNLAAQFLESHGCEPCSPAAGDPECDLLWAVDQGSGLVVAEVKSLTTANEEKQLRLGLGQVLRYCVLYAQLKKRSTTAALIVEREPTDGTWESLCATYGVALAWPETFSRLLIDV